MTDASPDPDPDGPTADEEADDRPGLDRTLSETLSIHLTTLDTGEIKVRVLEDRDETEGMATVLTSKEKSDFFTKRQSRREIANAIADNVETTHATEAKEVVLEFFNDLADADEETRKKFQHPTVQNVFDATESVKVFGGEPTTWSVEIDWNRFSATLEFTHGEWVKDSAHTFKKKFNQAFFETPRLENDDWLDLREMWENMREVEGVERTTTDQLIAEDVVRTLQQRVDCYEDRSKLRNDTWAAWYDIENSAGRSEPPRDQDVLWVQSSALKDALDDAGKEVGYMSQLSKALQTEGYTFSTSTPITAGSDADGNRVQPRCYPFDPVTLGKTPQSIHDRDIDEDDDEDDGDGDGEAGDDGDVGDDGGAGDGDDGSDGPDGKEVVPDGGTGYGATDHRDDGRLLPDGGRPADEPADRAEVVRLNGCPGAGKTYSLIQYAEQERREHDRGIDDLLFCTFTRAGMADMAGDLVDVSGFRASESEIRDRVKTVHGTALGAALRNDAIELPPDSSNLDRAIIYDMQQDAHVYREFCEQHGLSFTPQETNPLKLVRDGEDVDPTGNRLFAIYQWLKLERKPLRKHIEAPVGLPMADRRVHDLLEAWEAFKRDHYESRKYEHVDYIDLCIDRGYAPETDVLFIDEFQDLSPQEYLLYKTWRDSGRIDRVYIAGDVNQSIYSFRAGTPWYFRETPVDREEYVTESYRCPAAVVDVARTALEACGETDPQGFAAKTDGGTATHVSLDNDDALGAAVGNTLDQYDDHDDDETVVFLLARTNYQVGRIGTALGEAGIPFKGLSGRMDPWDETLTSALRVLRALRDGESVPKPALNKLLASNVGGYKHRRQTLRMLDGALMGDYYRADSVWQAFEDCADVREIASLVDVSDYQREMLRAAVATDVAPDPRRVRVGTIHAAKGSEAPVVYLFNAVSKRIHDEYLRGDTRAEEHRVTYVGATRASEELYVVENYFGSPYPLAGLDETRDGPPADGEVVA